MFGSVCPPSSIAAALTFLLLGRSSTAMSQYVDHISNGSFKGCPQAAAAAVLQDSQGYLHHQPSVRDSMGYFPHPPQPKPPKQGPGIDISIQLGEATKVQDMEKQARNDFR